MFTCTNAFTCFLSILSSVYTRCTSPDVNRASLELIKEFEGFVPSPQSDPVGYPTVGYGHLCSTSKCDDVDFPFPLSEETATQLLAIDLIEYEDGLTEALSDEVTLNANQYGALVSWTYNMGVSAVTDSSLVSRLNDGEDPENAVEDELPQWVHAGSKVLTGLVRRRNAEIELFTNDTSVKALPLPCYIARSK